MLTRRSTLALVSAATVAPTSVMARTPTEVMWDDLIPFGVPYSEINSATFEDPYHVPRALAAILEAPVMAGQSAIGVRPDRERLLGDGLQMILHGILSPAALGQQVDAK